MSRKRKVERPVFVLEAGLLLSCLVIISCLLLAGCEGRSQLPPDPELERAQALGLEPGARLHRVLLGGRGAEEHVLPELIQARPGDAVEFVTVDHRIHRVVFPPDSLDSEVHAFLRSRGTDASPPLPARGSLFLLRLDGAPEGRYPFLSHGHGGTAHGVIELSSDTLPGGG